MFFRSKLYGVAALAMLSSVSCSHAPKTYIPNDKFCHLKAYDVEVSLPNNPTPATISNYQRDIESAIDKADAPLLFLSGGSQNGAFGAGYLSGWAEAKDGLPKFSIVTGVSTGALQSTAAFIGKPEINITVAEIKSEGQLLETYVTGSDIRDSFKLPAIAALAFHGAVSDLVPLRNVLRNQITSEVLEQVADGYTNGRRLYVGVTDFDTGKAVAIDMTELAHRYVTNREAMPHLQDCYHEALVASSIVPAAAKPVFIDNRMYIDGGVRFAVFSEPLGERVLVRLEEERKRVDRDKDIDPFVFMILNGDGEAKQRCGKANKDDDCINEYTARPDRKFAPHERWDVLTLATRSVSLLINQVMRLSVDRAATLDGRSEDALVFAAIINIDKDAHEMSTNVLPASLIPQGFKGSKSCSEWREIDEKLDDPVEFHPRYMHCLVSYGQTTAKAQFKKGDGRT
jgi:hypothetical protein